MAAVNVWFLTDYTLTCQCDLRGSFQQASPRPAAGLLTSALWHQALLRPTNGAVAAVHRRCQPCFVVGPERSVDAALPLGVARVTAHHTSTAHQHQPCNRAETTANRLPPRPEHCAVLRCARLSFARVVRVGIGDRDSASRQRGLKCASIREGAFRHGARLHFTRAGIAHA